MKKILVHLHLYYKDQADMFAQKIKSALNGHDARLSYDLFITINEHDCEIERDFLSFKPDAKFIIVKNIGADIFPFITVLNLIDLKTYDYIIKLHTKKIYDVKKFYEDNSFYSPNHFSYIPKIFWNNYLTSFLTFENMGKILTSFEKNEKLGMVADYRVITGYKRRRKLIYPAIIKGKLLYPAGTMFIARAHIFNSIKQLNLDETKFSTFKSCDNSPVSRFLYGMEQTIGNCAIAEGLKLQDVYTPKLQIIMWKFISLLKVIIIKKIFRFFYRIENGEKKICKIPIEKKRKETIS